MITKMRNSVLKMTHCVIILRYRDVPNDHSIIWNFCSWTFSKRIAWGCASANEKRVLKKKCGYKNGIHTEEASNDG